MSTTLFFLLLSITKMKELSTTLFYIKLCRGHISNTIVDLTKIINFTLNELI